jgi:zinc and cadmium transporter
LLAYAISFNVDVGFLIPFAAGDFLYIGASDLVPEVNKHKDVQLNLFILASFLVGLSLMYLIRVTLGH